MDQTLNFGSKTKESVKIAVGPWSVFAGLHAESQQITVALAKLTVLAIERLARGQPRPLGLLNDYNKHCFTYCLGPISRIYWLSRVSPVSSWWHQQVAPLPGCECRHSKVSVQTGFRGTFKPLLRLQ